MILCPLYDPRGTRRPCVLHRESAAVKGLPEGAETSVQGAEGVSEETPEENLRASQRDQQQIQEDGQTVQQEQVHTYTYTFQCGNDSLRIPG